MTGRGVRISSGMVAELVAALDLAADITGNDDDDALPSSFRDLAGTLRLAAASWADEPAVPCVDCGRPAFYDSDHERWAHRDAAAACFLIPAREAGR